MTDSAIFSGQIHTRDVSVLIKKLLWNICACKFYTLIYACIGD